MSRRAAAAYLALTAAFAMLAEETWRLRQIERELRDELGAHDRFVDFGVRLVTVRMDLERGRELVPGAPPLIAVDERVLGGVVDTRADEPCFVGPSRAPALWYVSAEQAPLVLHDDSLPDRLLVDGSEGAGKTRAQAMWCGLRALEFTGDGLTIGMTAPTGKRAMHIREAIDQTWPAHWWRWSERHQFYYLANGVRVLVQSTHQASRDEGSPIQGGNWAASGNDEIQDSLHADPDIEMRLRAAPRGRGRRFATSTAKDAPGWRTWRDQAIAKGAWHRAELDGRRSPFVWPSFWEEKKTTLSPREYERRVGRKDLGPERQLYHSWSRAENLRPVPRIGAEHCTGEVLAHLGNDLGALVGHDPGLRTRASYVLRAYRLPGARRHVWWVVDEIVSEEGTIEQHVVELLARVRERWGCNLVNRHGRLNDGAMRALVHADPYTDTGHDEKRPDRSVYTQFRNAGFTIAPAAVRTDSGRARPAQIPKEARIDMVNRLLCDAADTRRLYVACDEARLPCAPRLVAAFESMERDASGRAETERKGQGDQSHFGAAVGYALWKLERVVRDDARGGRAGGVVT